MLAPSSYPKFVNNQMNIIRPCNSCHICKHYLVAEGKCTSKVTDTTYFIKGNLSCNTKNVIYKTGKNRFSGEQSSVLLKASSGARCAPLNFVLLVTLRGTSVCLTVYLTVHQMKQTIEGKMFK